MIDRRHAIRLMSGTILSTALSVPPLVGRQAFASSQDSDRERRDGREAQENPLLYELRLRTRVRQLLVTQIFILGASQLLLMRTAAGVEQFNENRLALSAIPILGALSRKRYAEDDFTSANHMGAVYADGTALFIYLFPELMLNPEVRMFLFLNLAYSFALRGGIQGTDWTAMAAAMPALAAIGTVRRAVESRLSGKAQTTTAAAPNMDHLAMGGLVSDETQGQSRIPAIGDIPVLKGLFTAPLHKTSDGKLVIVIRPSIVYGDRET